MAPFWKGVNLAKLNPFRKLAALNPLRREGEFLALDIGSSAIKMVEAVGERRVYNLINLGVVPLPATAVQNNIVVEKDVVVQAIRSLIQANGVKATKVISAVPGRAVIIKKIQLPAQGEQELEANVEFEAASVIPESLENVNLDYQILGFLDHGSKMEVLLVAVKKEIINSYTQAIQEAGLIPAVIDVDYFALENMYEISYQPKADEVVALIHIGARYASINVLKSGLSTFTGDLAVGGEEFTRRLIEEFQIPYAQAETLKITGVLDGKRRDDLATLLRPTSESFAEEVSRSISLYGTMAAEEGIHRVYLSGGSAKVAGLGPVLEERLKIPVQLSEPFRGFNIARNIDRDYLTDSELALALGAGLSIRRPGDK